MLRIFAILTALQTISHQDRWCTFYVWKPACSLLILMHFKVMHFNLQVRTSSRRGIWPDSWSGHVMFGCSASGPFSTSVWRFPLRSTSLPRLWTARPVSYSLDWSCSLSKTIFDDPSIFWFGNLSRHVNTCFFSGVNTVTTLVESKKAQLVVIAHDVDPIEVSFSTGYGRLVKSCCDCLQWCLEFLHLNSNWRSKIRAF